MTHPTRRQVIEYSVLALPLAFAGLPLYIHAPDYYTRDFGLAIGHLGLILLAIRLFDAFQDPLIGYLCDRYARLRYSILSAGLLMLIIGLCGVFYGPMGTTSVALWFALSMILATTGFSILVINLNMLGGFWQSEPQQRTRISAWREAFALLGLLIAAMLPTALQTILPTTTAFQVLFWIFCILMATAWILFLRFLNACPASDFIAKESMLALRKTWDLMRTGSNQTFFLTCFLAHLAAAIPGVMVLFFIRDYLQVESLTGVFLFLYFISGALLMPLWVQLAKHLGRERAWFIAMLLSVATFIWALMLQSGDALSYGIICVLSGMALGADLALPPAIIVDRITQQQAQAQATQYYALLAFIPKIALALASGVSFLILASLGFQAGLNNTTVALNGLLLIYALVPCLIKLGAAVLLWRLIQKASVHHENLARSPSHGTDDLSE